MEQGFIAPISTYLLTASVVRRDREGKSGPCVCRWLMNWIRVAVSIGDDPDIHALAEGLDVRVAEAIGLVVGVLCKCPAHVPDGKFRDIPASLVERWAGWQGERGVFDREFRDAFLNAEGVWVSWEKHNGAAMRDAEAARQRAAEYRRRNAERLLESTPNGTANGTANGSLLRTNERTNQTTGGRTRQAAKTADANAPWCVECQGVVVSQPNGLPKKVHAPECSRA